MATQLVGLNDKTDYREWELVVRCSPDGILWGFYRDANHKGTISDSQFNVTHTPKSSQNWIEEAEEKLQMKFKCYSIFEEDYNQF